MDEKLFNSLCADCQAKLADAGMGPDDMFEDDEEESPFGEEKEMKEPSKAPVKSFDEADKRGAIRISIGMMPKGKRGGFPPKGKGKEK